MTIAAWGRTLHELALESTSGEQRPVPIAPGKSSRAPAVNRSDRAASPATRYPRFVRNGDEVIRVAWSKREKKEYRHKVSLQALRAVTVAIADHGAEGRVFTTDEILPVRNSPDGTEIPSYQAYVCISLLKVAGLIEQHGRQGYSAPRASELEVAAQGFATKLPKK
jgi:hypothetical protein